jgi:hypothetical protein
MGGAIMKKILVLVCSVVLVLGVAGSAGKGKTPAVSMGSFLSSLF